MPFIRVTAFPQSQEARAEMAEGITEVVHRVTKVPKEYIWVVFEPMPQESWSVGGGLVSEKK
jgi:4-oxalocrotonate tautomerase family enzyme